MLLSKSDLSSDIDKQLSKNVRINLNPNNSCRSPKVTLSNHNRMRSHDTRSLGSNVEWNREDETLGIDLVVVYSPAVPDFFCGLVVDVSKVPVKRFGKK